MKTKIYALIFALLIGFLAYTLYTKSSSEKESKKEKSFKIDDFSKVTEIRILDKQADEVSLKRINNQWVLNDKYPVNEHIFKGIEDALTQMKAVKPVSKVSTESVIFEMIQHAKKVSIFEGKDQPSKVIFIGGPNNSNTASNMLLEFDGKPAKRIYEVSIPGHRGYLTSRFSAKEAVWRSKTIFKYSPEQVKAINIKYFNKYGKQDFTINNDKQNFTLTIDNKNLPKELLNQERVLKYLLKLEHQQLMDFSFQKDTDKFVKDSLLQVNKYAEIRITDNQNHEKLITVVDMPVNKGSSSLYDDQGNKMTYDIDYKYIIFGKNKDWGLINVENFGNLLIDPNKFLHK